MKLLVLASVLIIVAVKLTALLIMKFSNRVMDEADELDNQELNFTEEDLQNQKDEAEQYYNETFKSE